MGLKSPQGLCRLCLQPTGSKRRRYCDLHRKSKYRSQKVEVDGLTFDSKKEARRWDELIQLENAGVIRNLTRQVDFDLIVNGVLIARYRADMVYEENGERVVEDVKGMRTATYRIKRKLLHALFSIVIKES